MFIHFVKKQVWARGELSPFLCNTEKVQGTGALTALTNRGKYIIISCADDFDTLKGGCREKNIPYHVIGAGRLVAGACLQRL